METLSQICPYCEHTRRKLKTATNAAAAPGIPNSLRVSNCCSWPLTIQGENCHQPLSFVQGFFTLAHVSQNPSKLAVTTRDDHEEVAGHRRSKSKKISVFLMKGLERLRKSSCFRKLDHIPAHTLQRLPILKIKRSLGTPDKAHFRRALLGHNISPRTAACAGDTQEGRDHPNQIPAESSPKDDDFFKVSPLPCPCHKLVSALLVLPPVWTYLGSQLQLSQPFGFWRCSPPNSPPSWRFASLSCPAQLLELTPSMSSTLTQPQPTPDFVLHSPG